MNRRLRKLLMHGFRRRKKEILRTCIATFLAVFFIGGVLLFQENMYQWQMAENRKQFGDWFVLEGYAQTKGLVGHEYLKEAVAAKNYVRMYNDKWEYTNGTVGWMSTEFMEQGNVRLADGRLPEADNEIVCDYNTLTKLGYTAELGQEIHFNYYNEDKKSSTKEPERSASFILTGVLENFADVWNGSRHVPGALLSEDGCKKLDAAGYMVYIYQLKDNVRLDDYQPLYEEMSGYNSKRVYFNTNLYDFKPWGPTAIYNYIYLLVMVIGIAALTYQIISYQHSRTEHYRKMYYLGTSRGTIWQSRFLENVLILVPSGLLGVAGAFASGRVIGWLLEAKKGVAFFHINLDVTLKSLLSILVALVAAELVNLYMTYVSKMDFVGSRVSGKRLKEKRLEVGTELVSNMKIDAQKAVGSHENPVEMEMSETLKSVDLKQANTYKPKLRKNNVTWQMHVRLSRSNGIGMRLGARLFALAITGVLVFCAMNIYDAFRVYKK